MRCPFCFDADTRVVDSRLVGEGEQIRRRRECKKCTERFTTYESAELHFPKILKSDGRCEPFDEDKLREGIARAIEKRPVAMDKIEVAISRIKLELKDTGENEVDSSKLGKWVMVQLRRLDQVAYIRFVSVHRGFEDVRAFLDEIESLENELPPEIQESQLDLLKSLGGDI